MNGITPGCKIRDVLSIILRRIWVEVKDKISRLAELKKGYLADGFDFRYRSYLEMGSCRTGSPGSAMCVFAGWRRREWTCVVGCWIVGER